MNNLEIFFKEYKIKDNLIYLSIIEIEKLDVHFKKNLDEKISIICEGTPDGNLITIKKRIQKYFENKSIKWQMGAIAEFFVHLFIGLMNYEQQCLFFNLEERQIKKGFDGLYTKNDEEWIMESKSGSINTKNINHKNKIKEAIVDLNKKLSGDSTNDPWKNAYNHAAVVLRNRNSNLLDKIKNLSDDFINDKFYTISDFNIIPSATIFLDNVWNPSYKNKISTDIEDLLINFSFQKAHIVCISQKTINLFKEYIGIKE